MPLDSNVEMKSPEKKDWPVIPEDVYQVEITDIAAEEAEWKGEKKDVFKFEFTFIEPGQYYGRKLWKKGSRVSPIPYKNGKNPLTWKVASAVARHPLTEPEGKAYTIADMNAMIGKQIRVGVSVTAPKDDGKQYNNADSFFTVKQELPKFDESKVVKDEGTKQAPLTPADTVAKANMMKDEGEDMEFGEVDSADVPY